MEKLRGLIPDPLDDSPAVTGLERTVRITGFLNFTFDPPYKIPLFDFGKHHWEYELGSIPVGKALGDAGRAVAKPLGLGAGVGVGGAAALQACGEHCKETDTKASDRGLVRNIAD
jgi:hypothetical protein